MLMNLRNAMMAGKRLPYDAEVEYLESTGTQWIDTGVKKTTTTTIDCLFSLTDTSTSAVFGGRISNLTTDRCVLFNAGTYFRFDAAKLERLSDLAPNTTSIFHFLFDGSKAIVTDTTTGNFGSSTVGIGTGGTMSIALFANNTNGTIGNYLKGRIYSFKMWNNGTLVRDYIPVRKGSVGYLYDRVSGRLFGNAGTGDFVLGQDVVPVEYIESHGTEYIDTGLVATANNAFGAEVGFDTTVIDHGGTGTTNTVCICGANNTAASGFELRWQYASDSLIPVGGSYGNYSATPLTRDDILAKPIVAKNMNGHITYDVNGARLVDKTATVSDAGFVNGSVLLFGVRRRTYVQGITLLWAKMKYAKFYYNDNIAESLLPVRVGTEGAMMDVLTRRIYRNAGTGAFAYGNDLKYPIPAE